MPSRFTHTRPPAYCKAKGDRGMYSTPHGMYKCGVHVVYRVCAVVSKIGPVELPSGRWSVWSAQGPPLTKASVAENSQRQSRRHDQ
nr:hypothetical protein CFP56_07998 [Quercus suber]